MVLLGDEEEGRETGVRLDTGVDSSMEIDIDVLSIDEASTTPSANTQYITIRATSGFCQASV